MVLNEYGLNFIEIPFSGSDRFIKEFNLNNQEVKNSDNIIPDIEYHNLSIVKNPYYRACYFYRNGSKITFYIRVIRHIFKKILKFTYTNRCKVS